MKKLLACAAFSVLMIASLTAARAEDNKVAAVSAIPDFKSCPALRNEAAYGKDYDDYKMLFAGKDGFVFRSGQDLRSDFAMKDDAIALYKEFSDALKVKNIDLIIAFIPTRGMAAKDALPDSSPLTKNYDPSTAIANYTTAIAKMNANGIHVAGTPELKSGAKYFYKTDQHWTTAGATEMAQAIGKKIKKLSSYGSIKKTKFKTIPTENVSFYGRFNEAIEPMCNFKMPMEQDTMTETSAVTKEASKENLFGDSIEPEIALVGTSNSKKNDHDLNFDGHIKTEISADIYNAAITGGGFDDSLIAYLVSDQFKKNPPKVIIWEIPGYYALDGETSRKTLFQAIPSIQGDCTNPIAVSEPVKLKGEIVTLLNNLEGKNALDADSYVYLNFDAPVKKNFSVTVNNQDDSKQTLKFSRSKRYPHDGNFYYAPGKKMESPVKSVTLKIPPQMYGLKATAKLCPQK